MILKYTSDRAFARMHGLLFLVCRTSGSPFCSQIKQRYKKDLSKRQKIKQFFCNFHNLQNKMKYLQKIQHRKKQMC